MKKIYSILIIACVIYSCKSHNDDHKDTFPELKEGVAPQSVEELWEDFDPRKEPLEVEILHEWVEDGVIMQVLRYRVGVFKGVKAKIAAIYGYPKGSENLPGLVQIHGGGQYADYRAVLTNAKRGYATISISWAGRINAPEYKVTPDIVKLFWANKTDDPEYKITTDWGIMDGYHAPCRNKENNFALVTPNSWTLDSIESPRNSSWFLAVTGARRAITFLEEQDQVDANKIGVYGHSMGGKITVLTSIDSRVKVSVPSCGGISNNNNDSNLYNKTIGDNPYLKHIMCPIMFLSPTNDFHGNLQDIPNAIKYIKTNDWRVVSSAHHSHQDHGDFEVSGLLWIDQHLKGTFTVPNTPQTELKLDNSNKIPSLVIKPDESMPVLEVDVYYTQQGEFPDSLDGTGERNRRKSRFWHFAKARKKESGWVADLPLLFTNKKLWAYANVCYKLDETVTGAGYYYRIYHVNQFNLSSPIQIASSEELKAANIKATVKPTLLIEDFKGDWRKGWFNYKSSDWNLRTHKVFNPKWKAPQRAHLEFEVRSEGANIMVVGIDNYAKQIKLQGGDQWQKIVLSPSDFKNASGEALKNWSDIKELRLSANESLKEKTDGQTERIKIGVPWKGNHPEFRNLRWNTLVQ